MLSSRLPWAESKRAVCVPTSLVGGNPDALDRGEGSAFLPWPGGFFLRVLRVPVLSVFRISVCLLLRIGCSAGRRVACVPMIFIGKPCGTFRRSRGGSVHAAPVRQPPRLARGSPCAAIFPLPPLCVFRVGVYPPWRVLSVLIFFPCCAAHLWIRKLFLPIFSSANIFSTLTRHPPAVKISSARPSRRGATRSEGGRCVVVGALLAAPCVVVAAWVHAARIFVPIPNLRDSGCEFRPGF